MIRAAFALICAVCLALDSALVATGQWWLLAPGVAAFASLVLIAWER